MTQGVKNYKGLTNYSEKKSPRGSQTPDAIRREGQQLHRNTYRALKLLNQEGISGYVGIYSYHQHLEKQGKTGLHPMNAVRDGYNKHEDYAIDQLSNAFPSMQPFYDHLADEGWVPGIRSHIENAPLDRDGKLLVNRQSLKLYHSPTVGRAVKWMLWRDEVLGKAGYYAGYRKARELYEGTAPVQPELPLQPRNEGSTVNLSIGQPITLSSIGDGKVEITTPTGTFTIEGPVTVKLKEK